MMDILLIDEQSERTQPLAAGLRAQGLGIKTLSHLPSIEEAFGYSCLIALQPLIDHDIESYAAALPVIVLSSDPTINAAVACVKRGATDYLALPVSVDQLRIAAERAQAANTSIKKRHVGQFPMIGSSEPMRHLKKNIAKVAPTDSTVLVLGQSGTGKELVARAIHAASNRSKLPLITINCATVPHDLIETELFGIEPFDNAKNTSRGLIDAAEGGTLFLDEIAELPASAQARLLCILQGENRRVGSAISTPADVRIIAATHRNLGQQVEQGKFREDLFHRLNVIRLELLPLQARSGDVAEIAQWLLERNCQRLNKRGLSFSQEANEAMRCYHWPGNVRELENAIERAVILSDDGSRITQSLLAIKPDLQSKEAVKLNVDDDQTSLEDYFVRFVLDHQDQLTETELAEKLGISRKSLWERRQRLNIPRRKTRKRGPRRDATQ